MIVNSAINFYCPVFAFNTPHKIIPFPHIVITSLVCECALAVFFGPAEHFHSKGSIGPIKCNLSDFDLLVKKLTSRFK